MITGAEFFGKPIVVGGGIGLKRSLSADGATISVSVKPGFSTANLDPNELQDLHVWLGNTLAWLRHVNLARKASGA
jgi:hypothetical protein